MKIKTEISNWDLIKLKSFSTVQEIVNKTTTHRIFANDAIDKGLISNIFKQLKELNIRKQTT